MLNSETHSETFSMQCYALCVADQLWLLSLHWQPDLESGTVCRPTPDSRSCHVQPFCTVAEDVFYLVSAAKAQC